jgi:hypothetical protein
MTINLALRQTSPLGVAFRCALLLACAPLVAADPPPVAPPSVPPASPPAVTPHPDPAPYIPPEPLKFSNAPQIRVDFLLLSLPVENAIRLLPALHDPERIDSAQAQLLAMVDRHEADLIDWPEVTTSSGERAVSETITEERWYFEPDKPVKLPGEAVLVDEGLGGSDRPGFLTRDTGAVIEVLPDLYKDGKTISLLVAPKLSAKAQKSEPVVGHDPAGQPITSHEPVFSTFKVQTHLEVRNGHRHLLFAGRSQPDGPMVLIIVGASVIPPQK